MPPPVPDTLTKYLYQPWSRSPVVNWGRRLDRDAQRGAVLLVLDLFRGSLRMSRKVVHKIIDFVARDDPNSLPACALVSRKWNYRATYHLRIMRHDRLPVYRLPVELIHNIMDLVAQHGSSSLRCCALVSRGWRSCAKYHLEKLTKPYHHVQITAIPKLYAVVDVIKNDGYLAQLPRSLDISPNPEASSTSYIPFLDLSSCALPNVNRLILGEGLRWADYPPLYNNGVVGSPFYSVTILDLYCRFKSPQSLFLAIRSFRNLEEVHLLHPDPCPPIQAAPALFSVKLRKPLQLLEVPVSPCSLCFLYIAR